MDASSLIRAFYTWYLEIVKSDTMLAYREEYRGILLKYITVDFCDLLPSIKETTNADPFLCIQDMFTDWVHNIHVFAESTTKFRVEFTYATNIKHIIYVIVTTNTDGELFIDDVMLQ